MELVLYMPLLFSLCFLTIQFSLVYLGTQVAASAAREGARLARQGVPSAEVKSAAESYATRVGRGLIENPRAVPEAAGPGQVRVTVNADAVQILPWVPLPDISMVSEGPTETFRPDGG